MTANKQATGDGRGTPEYRRVARALYRFVASDPRYRRRLAGASRTKQDSDIKALNRTILRLAAGEDVSPDMRKLLVRALSKGLRLSPGWPARGGVPPAVNAPRDRKVVGFIRGQIRKRPSRQLKTIYADAGGKFGLSTTQVRHIWARSK